MPRPRTCRLVQETPRVRYFKPQGVPLRELAELTLPVEHLEALRLSDLEGLTAAQAATRMGVSRHTFGRILAAGRRIVAEALTRGLALRIDGGAYEVTPPGPIPGPPPGPTHGPTHDQAPDQEHARNPAPEQAETHKETNMNRIAVTAQGPGLDSPVDPRFGRAAGFVLVDAATMEHRYVDNGASQTLAHGAGIHAAQTLSQAGAGVLLTGYVGPKAFQALRAAGINIGQDVDGVSVRQAVEAYLAGRVPFAEAPNK